MPARPNTERPVRYCCSRKILGIVFRAKMQSQNALHYVFLGVDWVLSLDFYLLCTFL